MLHVLITFNITFNCMLSPSMVNLLFWWAPGLDRVLSRRDLSGKVLDERFITSRVLLSKKYRNVNLRGQYNGKWKSRAEIMLLGVLLNSTHQTDRSFTNDFRAR